jgi:hypothetical protein
MILAAALIATVGAIMMSGSLGAGHQFPKGKASATIDPTALTLTAKNLPVVQVNEPF